MVVHISYKVIFKYNTYFLPAFGQVYHEENTRDTTRTKKLCILNYKKKKIINLVLNNNLPIS